MSQAQLSASPSTPAKKILIVEDEVIVGLDLKNKLHRLGYEVPAPINYGEEVKDAVAKEKPDLILMDISLKGAMNGLEASQVVNQSQQTPIIFLTAFSDKETLAEAKKSNPYGFLQKPISFDNLRLTIEIALYKAQLDQELRSSQEKYRRIFENSVVGIYQSTTSGTFIDVNQAFADIVGYASPQDLLTQIKDISTQYYADPEQRKIFQDLLSRQGHVKNFDFKIRTAAGSTRWISNNTIAVRNVSGEIDYYEGMIVDITEKKQLEQQLQQKHKMEAIGVMAGGIAHNFNNSLAVILGSIEVIQMNPDNIETLNKYLDYAKTAIFQSRELVQQILTYSRNSKTALMPLHLGKALNTTINLISTTMPSSVQLQVRIDPAANNSIISGNSSQLQESIINLCNNAVQAMDESGTLTISLNHAELTAHDIPPQDNCQPGHYAMISVADTGSGMDAETKARIFDPFFTTKPVDEGTGMGLATVQGIIDQHNGLIKVDSEPGHGTIFKLYFPLNGDSHCEKKAEETNDLPRGTEKILLVDDNKEVAQLGRDLLLLLGYEVNVMTESTEALKVFSADPDAFDLVITDQTMPRLSGKDLIQRLRTIRPDIPTILCTGFSSKISADEAKKQGVSAFMMKPIDFSQLARTIRTVLAG